MRRHHDDRNQVRVAGSFQAVAEVETVDVGQHQVEQNQVGLPLGDGRKGLRSREDLDGFKPLSLHQTGQDIVGVALIIDDQDRARHGQNSNGLREFNHHSCWN